MEQAKELGTFMFLLTGREPLERKEEVIALCNKHTDCQFMVFTNGLAIDEDFADQALRVKNFIGAIHVTGRTEDLRLDSIFALFKGKKLPYGVYCTYDKSDAEDFAQESFFDDIISRGAKFCWFFSSLKREEDRGLCSDENVPRVKASAHDQLLQGYRHDWRLYRRQVLLQSQR